MRYFLISIGVIVATLAQMTPASAAASTPSICDISEVDPVDTPNRLLLEYTSDASHWQPENKACAFYGRGLVYQSIGKSDEAISDYTRAIGWMSGLKEAYAARGDAYESRGEHEKAEADYAQASQIYRDSAQALNNICWERAKRGHPLAPALSNCDAAIKLRSDLWFIWDSRCLVDYRLGNYAVAISDCDKSLELWDVRARPALRAGTLYVRGLAKIKNGNVETGNSDIAAAEDIYPRVREKYAMLGVPQ